MYKRLWLLSVALMWPATVLAHSGDANDMDGGYMGGYGHMMDFSGGGVLMWILFFVLVGVLVYFMVRAPQARGPGMPLHETPLDILKRRYAQGEITKQQFDEMKRDL
jgi:putative membrane protein